MDAGCGFRHTTPKANRSPIHLKASSRSISSRIPEIMTFDEAKNAVLALLRQQGKAKNSEMLALIGGSRELLAQVREDILFEELAEDLRGGVGLRFTGPAATPVGSSGPVRLFLSYGRRDASDLAERLERDLKQANYEVWRDTREIRPGTAWGAEIADGLRSSQIMVALMTPHSTRTTRDTSSPDAVDSVCLGEIAHALFNPPPQAIVPVMAKSCEAPLHIFHLDYVDLRCWQDSEKQYQAGLERLIDGIEAARRGEKRYRSWHHMLAPFDFAGFLHAKQDRFTGRQWLFDAIDAWRSVEQGRALLIKGDPGVGKSAVVAELVHCNPGGQVLAYHCCQWDVGDTLEPWRFVRSIAAMIAGRSEDFAALLNDPNLRDILSEESCRRDAGSAFERGVLDALQHLHAPEGGPRFLLVDALDEALAVAEGQPTIVSLLASRLDRMPPWLRIVATTRKDPRVIEELRGLKATEIEAQSEDNIADLKNFIRSELKSPVFVEAVRESGIPAEMIASQMVEKSGGNFLYVREALNAVALGNSGIERLEDLPPGIAGLYTRRFKKLFPTEASFSPLVPLLEVICAAHEPVSRSLLAAACSLDEDRSVDLLLRRITGYIARRLDGTGRLVFTIFHKSFSDWLTATELDGEPQGVSVRKGNLRLADWCLAECRRDPTKMDRYALRHTAAHLVAAERWDELIGDEAKPGPLTDLGFIQAKCEAGLIHDLVGDYNAALTGLPEFAEENGSLAKRDTAMSAYNKALRGYAIVRYEWLQAKARGKSVAEPSYPLLPLELKAETNLEIPEKAAECAARLRHFSNFVNAHIGPLVTTPHDTLPLAFNFAEDGPVVADAQRNIVSKKAPWLRRSPRPPVPTFHPQCLRTFQGHVAGVSCVSLGPGGHRALSGSWDKTLRLWNLETGECLRILKGHSKSINSVCVSPDGRKAISGSSDSTLRVWNLETGECLRTLEAHCASVNSVCVSPDGRRVLSGSADNTLRVWDLETGECLRTLEGHNSPVYSVCVSPDGHRALSGSSDNTLRLWDLDTGACLRTLEAHSASVNSVCVSPDGCRALSGSDDRTLRVWNLDTGECLRTLERHSDWVKSVGLSPDGCRAISGCENKTLRIWDLDTGKCLRTLEGHSGGINSVSVSQDGRRALSSAGGYMSSDKTLRLWDLEASECLRTLEAHSGGINSVNISLDGRRLLSGSDDKTLRLWNLETGECLRILKGHKNRVSSVNVSPDGRRALSGCWDKTLRLWDLETGECLRILEGHSDGVNSVYLNPDGNRAISGSWDNTLRVWDLKAGECLYSLKGHSESVNSVCVSPDGCHAFSGSWDKTLRVWDLKTGKCLLMLEGHTKGVNSVCVSPDGRRALSGCYDQTLRLWDLKTGKCLRTLKGHSNGVNSVCVSLDGCRAISGSSDNTLRVWDLETDESLAIYNSGSAVGSAALSTSTGNVVCGTLDGQMHFLTPVNFPNSGLAILTASNLRQARCPCCAIKFAPPPEVIAAIRQHTATLLPDHSPCLTLPDAAFNDSRLITDCPQCGKPLKFNPFFVHQFP